MVEKVFVGFGFGPIQGGLFVKEAFCSDNFARIVVAEIDQKLVDAVRANGGSYNVNVAGSDGIEVFKIDGIELLNPTVEADRQLLIEALTQATEIVTSLPAVKFYDMGDNSVASLIANAIKDSKAGGTIIYAAENNNHAAEILQDVVSKKLDGNLPGSAQFLNTVIGKMSQTVNDAAEIEEKKLTAMTPQIKRAFLVEAFNKILVTCATIAGFKPGIEVFLEKDDLLPFEEAKLYGHNAIHALLAYLGAMAGLTKMLELKDSSVIMEIGRAAFLDESGAALIKKYTFLDDELFTEAGYKDFAEDLLERMTNPHLSDPVERAGRDPLRKLGVDDRIFGTMTVALQHGVEPINMALGAMAGVVFILNDADKYEVPGNLRIDKWRELSDEKIAEILNWIWRGGKTEFSDELISLVQRAKGRLAELFA